MIGIIDVGGGNRAVFADGVFDYLMDNNIYLDYCIGVSAGAANCVSYIAHQRGRNLNFYTKYNFSSMAIGLLAFIKTRGSFVDLDFIYGKLSNSTGKCPLDYEAVKRSSAIFKVVATDADTGEAVYFDKSDLAQDDYRIISASSCEPLACKPYKYKGRRYFDGYVSDPVPIEKAFADGCDKVIVILTLPKDHIRSGKGDAAAAEKLQKYPAISEKLSRGAQIYNRSVKIALDMEAAGKALILCPDGDSHMKSLEKDKDTILRFYQSGYDAGEKIKGFLGI